MSGKDLAAPKERRCADLRGGWGLGRERVPVGRGAAESTSSSSMRERQARGREAEGAVARYLQAHGFQIIERNLRLGRLEIDLVARRQQLAVVVEVRTRGNGAWTRPLGSLGRAKRARVRRAGERLWRKRLGHDPSLRLLRFDAAGVRFGNHGPEVDYVAAAF